MKKIIIFGSIIITLIIVLIWFGKKNSASPIKYEIDKPFITSITKKSIATGKVTPLEEIEIKPQITGIIDKILLLEGAKVVKGDLIATVRVVPNEQSLISAKGRVDNIKIILDNAKIALDRNKNLFERGVISKQEFENIELNYNQTMQDLKNAQNDYQIIKSGSSGAAGAANTNIYAQMTGTILEIPVKEGDQVIQSNNFNAGTTIASIADMNKMIFEGKVDESEVGKLINGSEIEVSIGAIEGKKFPAKLTFIAPKGTEEAGAVQFKIKADVLLDANYYIRAGYSANAEIVLEKKDKVMAIKESLLQFDKITEKPFVEIKISEEKYEKRFIELGTSDGVNVQILKGLKMEDEIKIWNKTTKEDEKEEQK